MKLSTLFSDGAVLQRGMPIPVWGTAKPDAYVTIRIGTSFAQGFASTDGDFMIRVPELPAGGPYTILAEDVSNGEKVEVKDVLVGEVWLASGQSNMEFTMQNSPQITDFLKSNRDPSTLRMFTVAKRASTAHQKNPEGVWEYSSFENIPRFSAVATWFADVLREKLGVPVGIIHSSWGGTFIEAWTSRNTLMRNPAVRDAFLRMENELASSDIWKNTTPAYVSPSSVASEKFFEEHCVKDAGNSGLGKGWAERGFDDSGWLDYQIPGSWIAQKIAGNGVVWARYTLDIPERWAGKDLKLMMGGIDKQDITYFNGVEIGRTGKGFEDKYWCTVRDYKVPGNLVKAGKSVVAVRAYSFLFDGGFCGMDEFFFLAPADDLSDKIPIAGTWKAGVEQDFGIIGTGYEQSKGPNVANSFSILFDSMIRPLIPYAMRGAIWYQGETNASTIEESVAYERLMKDMISDWRFFWGQGDFPFYMVQLANFRNPSFFEETSTWAPLRESQRHACDSLPNTGMAVITDCGDVLDIHPKDKRTVGERLAALALHDTFFKQDAVACGPLPVEVRKENGGLRILFSHADGGLVFRSDDTKKAFRIAGVDGVYQEADTAEIDGAGVFVKSSKVDFPFSVRYNWADCPKGKLYNGAGFPASPFEEK